MPPDPTPADAAASDRTRAALSGVGWFVAFIGLLLAFSVAFYTLGVRYGVHERPWFAPSLSVVVWLSAAAALAWPASRPVGVRRTLALRGCTRLQLSAGVFLAVALVPTIALAAGVAHNLASGSLATFDAVDEPVHVWGLWALLLGGFVPVVAEEAVFRGFIGRRLVTAFGTAGGVIATSLLFAATRVEPAAAAGAFVMGVALHAAFLATRSFVVPVAMHAAANALSAFDRLALGRGFDILAHDDNGLPAPAIVFFGLVAAAAAVWTLAAARTRWRLPSGMWNPTPLPAPLPPRGIGATAEMLRPSTAPLAAAAVAVVVLVAATYQVGQTSKAPTSDRVRPSSGDSGWKALLAGKYRDQGDTLRRDGQPADAVAAYSRALEYAPGDGHSLGNRGLAHADLDDAAAAERDLAAATRLVPDEAQYWRFLGWSRMQLGRYEQSLDDFATVLRLVPNDDYALRRRGSAFVKLKRWRDAVAEYDRALRTAKPTSGDAADLHANRGKALSELGRYGPAVDDFAAALRDDPRQSTAAYELAWIRAACPEPKLRDGRAALTAARALCAESGGRTAANLSLLAAALMECGEAGEAVRNQSDALALAADGERGVHERALALYREGRPYRLPASPQ